ncbi:hypothetical protein [Pseudomonas sp. R37(2017)]|uniref:hypothetical protein n=1 Tax=Pseudomonas sp. R37(2017) TaxID=1981685 RepID=UPI000A1FBA02|nr:hypothetical protein [Pseudomonas sp. R37(2017)]
MKRLAWILCLFPLAGAVNADVLDIKIDRKASLQAGGSQVVVSGTVTCDVSSDSIFNNVTLFPAVVQFTQGKKIFNISAPTQFDTFPCSDPTTPSPYVLLVRSSGLPFKPGQATVSITVLQVQCNEIACHFSNRNLNQEVVLNP